MPCTKDDSNNTTTTHEDCEENITFNLEEENNYTQNEVSSIVHKEHMGTKKDVYNVSEDEYQKITTMTHEAEPHQMQDEESNGTQEVHEDIAINYISCWCKQ